MDTHSIDWTRPDAYLRGVSPASPWQRMVAHLSKLIRMAQAESRLQRDVRMLRALRYATRDMPDYLRRDIGLDP